MKTRISMLILALSGLLGLCGVPAGAFETVVVDAGHGGNDEGTKWYHIAEKDVTLAVAKRLATVLDAKGITVMQTRTDDRYVSLTERAEMANRTRNSLLVSIHFNSSSTNTTSGFQTYHFFESPSSRLIAQSIQNTLAEKLGRPSRGVMKNDFAVLTRTYDCAVLVECGFISNKKEAMYFASEEGQQALAEALAIGILRVKPVINNDPPSCVDAKCALIAKRDAAAERKLLLSGMKIEAGALPGPTVAAVAPAHGGFDRLRGITDFKVSTAVMPSFASMLREMLTAYDERFGSE